MAEYVNTSGGLLILPDGSEIKAGDSAEIDAKTVQNVGVSQWIGGGALEAVKPKPVETKREKK